MQGTLLPTLAILLIVILLLLTDRLRADLVALLAVVALGLTGVLTPREAFSGLASSAVITIVAISALAEALRITGMSDRAGELLLRLAGPGERSLIFVIMVAGAALSLVMNNIAAAAILLPAISGIARKSRVNTGRLLMPLAFATILGGMATLFTTTNIVVSGILRGQNLPGFGVLDFAPVGLPIVAAGIGYMTVAGRHLLPKHSGMEADPLPTNGGNGLADVYRLSERLFRARLPANSCLVGLSLAQSRLRETYGVNVIAIERAGRVINAPPPDTVLAVNDIVLLLGRLDEVQARDTAGCLEMLPLQPEHLDNLTAGDLVMVEVVLAPRSTLLGQTLRTVHFREKYGMSVLGIWRSGRPIRTGLGDLPLQFGDALLLQGSARQVAVLKTEPDLIVLDRQLVRSSHVVRRQGWWAAAILIGALVLATLNTALVGEIMLAAALLTVLLGIFTMDQLYAAIEWRTVFLVAGMLPLGLALTKSGAAALLANALVNVLIPHGPMALLIGLFVLTTLLTQTMSGPAVASVIAPIAVQTAIKAHLDPRALAMGVALATSMAFITPLGHPVNILVMGPGGYRFRDYLRVGLPLTLLLSGVVMLCLPIFWPLTGR
ncbi:MAG: SLC13 family permease [Anaerolineae bacterium]